MLDQTIRVYAVFSKPLKTSNKTSFTDIVLNESCNSMCSNNNSFLGWRGGKYLCMFLSVSCERNLGVCVYACVIFRVSQQANKCLFCLRLLFLSSPHPPRRDGAQRKPTQCAVFKERERERPAFCALFETETVESFCNLKQPS